MSTWEKYNKPRYVDAVKLTRFAMTRLGTSRDIYAAIGQPLVSRTDSALSHHITSSYQQENPDWHDEYGASDIIRYGVRDTQSLLFPYLSQRPSRESALDFLHHEHTMRQLAMAALQKEESLERLIRWAQRGTDVDPTIPSLEFPFHVGIPQPYGCPAAAIGNDNTPTKEFVDLSLLSGEVLIEALDHHGHFPEK